MTFNCPHCQERIYVDLDLYFSVDPIEPDLQIVSNAVDTIKDNIVNAKDRFINEKERLRKDCDRQEDGQETSEKRD